MMSGPTVPVPAALIPQPTSWSNARSFRSIEGMDNDEKFALQTCLRDLCDTYLDPTKLWTAQNENMRDKITEEACAECPYVRERYEGAWPIEAWLRSRLSSSKSMWRRKSEQPSRKPRPKPKGKAKVEENHEGTQGEDAPMEEPGTQETKNDMDVEVDELLGDDEIARMDVVPDDSDPFEGNSQDVNQALAEICSMGLPPVITSPSSSDATRVAHLPESSPTPQSPPRPPTQTAKRTPARKPRKVVSSTAQASTSTPRRPAGIKKPRITTSTKKTTPKVPEKQPAEPATSQGTDDSAIRQFLEGLAEPSVELLPRFVAHGVSSASSLRALGRVAAEERDVFLRRDLALNSFEICLVCDGLRRLVQ